MAMELGPQPAPYEQIAPSSWSEEQRQSQQIHQRRILKPPLPSEPGLLSYEQDQAGVQVPVQTEQYDMHNDEFIWDPLESQSALPSQSRFQQITHQENALPPRNEVQRQSQQISHPQISQPSPAVRKPTEETRYHEALGAVVDGPTIDENYTKPPEQFSSVLELQQIKQRQLEMLKAHDVEEWSKWRQEHSDIRPDLSGADLHGLDLRGFDLKDTIMANTDLRDTDLQGVNLSGAVLEHADMSGANLNLANLPEAQLSDAILVGTTLKGADLRQAKLIRANMTDADLSEAFLQDVDFTQAVSSKKTNLTEADMTDAILTGANFSGANLTRAILIGANLRECILIRAILVDAIMVEADLSKAYLNLAFLQGVDLSNAILVEARFRGADLSRAKLKKADMTNADLSEAILQDVDLTQAVSKETDLSEADLTEAILTGANLSGAILTKANFNGVFLSQTIFKNVDLRETIGLETAVHFEPSVIDIDTIYRSRSNVPMEFLHGAGVPDIIIDSMLVSANHPMKYPTCFISYSSKDEAFANRLYKDLSRLGVHCDFAPESLRSGEDFNSRIVEYIQNNDKFLLIFSQHSLESPWVEKEVQIATQKEDQLKQSVIFPFKIDNAVLITDQAWAEKIRDEDHIGDFNNWEQPGDYLRALAHLLRDLKEGS